MRRHAKFASSVCARQMHAQGGFVCGWTAALVPLLIALAASILFLSNIFFEHLGGATGDASTTHCMAHTHSRMAVVILPGMNHMEVAAPIACALHDVGLRVFFVTDFVGVKINNVEFAGSGLLRSRELFGHCVCSFVSIHNPEMLDSVIKSSPSLTVFVTYPDENWIEYQRDILEMLPEGSNVALVMHHDFDVDVIPKEKTLHRLNPTFLYLGQHVEKSAKLRAKNVQLELKTGFFYPVLPPEHMPSISKAPTESTWIIQGNVGGRHWWRRNMTAVFDCMYTQRSTTLYRPSLKIVGKGTVNVRREVQQSVKHIAGLPYQGFYSEISSGKFLIPACGSNHHQYAGERATSSVPAALMTRVPLIAEKWLLDLYPCLRDCRVHNLISKDTLCDSMLASLQLNAEDYREAKGEITRCGNALWEDLKTTMQALVK